VRFLADSARTHSLLMCTKCNWVRFVDGIHFFARERREEVRLLISPARSRSSFRRAARKKKKQRTPTAKTGPTAAISRMTSMTCMAKS
jgi:hypothetical protein